MTRPKTIRWFMALTAGLALLCGAVLPAAAQTAAKKPNILVIWGDDIGIHNISAYNLGLMGYRTPGIDRIAKEEGRVRSSPTPMRSRAALRGGPRSSSASTRFAPAC